MDTMGSAARLCDFGYNAGAHRSVDIPHLRRPEQIRYLGRALWTKPRVPGQAIVMARFISNAWLIAGLGFVLVTAADAAATYEPAHLPRIFAVAADSRSFYLEIRARNEVGGFGHSYVALGAIDASGWGCQSRSGNTLLAVVFRVEALQFILTGTNDAVA
jgi:hypothetical protein